MANSKYYLSMVANCLDGMDGSRLGVLCEEWGITIRGKEDTYLSWAGVEKLARM